MLNEATFLKDGVFVRDIFDEGDGGGGLGAEGWRVSTEGLGGGGLSGGGCCINIVGKSMC